jgi:hypothetical protein
MYMNGPVTDTSSTNTYHPSDDYTTPVRRYADHNAHGLDGLPLYIALPALGAITLGVVIYYFRSARRCNGNESGTAHWICCCGKENFQDDKRDESGRVSRMWRWGAKRGRCVKHGGFKGSEV